jgi:hypothetical protein
MTTRKEPSADGNQTKQRETTPCAKCQGAGMILTNEVHHTQAICRDQCEAGRRIWSRTMDLVAEMDVPSSLIQPERTDSIIRGLVPRRYETH